MIDFSYYIALFYVIMKIYVYMDHPCRLQKKNNIYKLNNQFVKSTNIIYIRNIIYDSFIQQNVLFLIFSERNKKKYLFKYLLKKETLKIIVFFFVENIHVPQKTT